MLSQCAWLGHSAHNCIFRSDRRWIVPFTSAPGLHRAFLYHRCALAAFKGIIWLEYWADMRVMSVDTRGYRALRLMSESSIPSVEQVPPGWGELSIRTLAGVNGRSGTPVEHEDTCPLELLLKALTSCVVEGKFNPVCPTDLRSVCSACFWAHRWRILCEAGQYCSLLFCL